MQEMTPEELIREHEYRRLEAEGLGRTPERAKAEADAWLAKINEKVLASFSKGAKKDETK